MEEELCESTVKTVYFKELKENMSDSIRCVWWNMTSFDKIIAL